MSTNRPPISKKLTKTHSRKRLIPTNAKIESDIPLEELIPLSVREGNKKKPIYELHKWWARRLGSNFRMLLLSSLLPEKSPNSKIWEAFYSTHHLKSLVVFDPFMGGGTSIVESTKLGARTIGNDIDPVAWFITKKEIDNVDIDLLRNAFERIKSAIADDLKQFYKHTTPTGDMGDVISYFWVTTIRCPACHQEFEAHPHFQLYVDKRNKRQAVFCNKCHEVKWLDSSRQSFRCDICGTKTFINQGLIKNGRYTCSCGHRGRIADIPQLGVPFKTKLFALEYEVPCSNSREFSKVDGKDIKLFDKASKEFNAKREDLLFPRAAIPHEGRCDKRPIIYGFSKYEQLFNARQLLCLSKICSEILRESDKNCREYLLLAFSDALASNNMLCSYAFGYRKLTPLFGLHAYRRITRPVEGNVWGTKFGRGSFTKCFEKLVRGKIYCKKTYESVDNAQSKLFTGEKIEARTTIDVREWDAGQVQSLLLNENSSKLDMLSDESVDLILTDPPYYNNLAYSEMSDFYYVWLKRAMSNSLGKWKQDTTPYKETLFVRQRNQEEHEKFALGMKAVFKECHRVLRSDGLMVFTFHHNDWRAWIVMAEAIINAGFQVTNVMPILSEGKSGFHSSKGNIKWDAVIVCRPTSIFLNEPLEPEKIIEFARTMLVKWKDRIKHAGKQLSKADCDSLALAFGCWYLSKFMPTKDQIKEYLHITMQEVSRKKVPLSLFRSTSSTEVSAIESIA